MADQYLRLEHKGANANNNVANTGFLHDLRHVNMRDVYNNPKSHYRLIALFLGFALTIVAIIVGVAIYATKNGNPSPGQAAATDGVGNYNPHS